MTLLYRFFSRRYGVAVALFVAAGLGLNAYPIFYSSCIFPEIAYTLCSVLGWFALLRYRAASRTVGWVLLLAAITLNAAIYLRSVGLTLLFAAILWLLWQRAWLKAAALPIAALLLSLPLQLGWVFGTAATWQGGYGKFLAIRDTLSLLPQQVVGYIFNVTRLLLEWPYQGLQNAALPAPLFNLLLVGLLALTVGLLILGVVRQRDAAGQLFLLYTALYMGVLMVVWPYAAHPRFMLPILPILLFYLFSGRKRWRGHGRGGGWQSPCCSSWSVAAWTSS